ncbi:uncharacterized protein PAC_12712 [Phialocephala subalpina]|uniref:Small secreted protein n=1 Tax=Phialocephala subalpina TaxID=576137 RepID=A0A1L7XCR8_9HELO|nr:uncharacterized protein PAC_12712 [Phialocephala subalpina]
MYFSKISTLAALFASAVATPSPAAPPPSSPSAAKEGSQQSCTFDSGVTFTWNIESTAWSQPDYALVGTGSNSFHDMNICKNDAQTRYLYTDGSGNSCYSIYYRLDQ